jgi:hypothetical protein
MAYFEWLILTRPTFRAYRFSGPGRGQPPSPVRAGAAEVKNKCPRTQLPPTRAVSGSGRCSDCTNSVTTRAGGARCSPAGAPSRESQTGKPRKLLADRRDHTDRYVIISDNCNAHADSIDDDSSDHASGICNNAHGSSRLE